MAFSPEIEIVLIEDSPYDTELTLRALEKKGLAGKVKTFPDGVEALNFLLKNGAAADGKNSGCPKVIFLDLKLPKMSGLEVLSQLKRDKRTRLIPVVMLTSSQEDTDISESYRLGANSYLVKPMDYDDFSLAVEELGLYWLKRNVVAI